MYEQDGFATWIKKCAGQRVIGPLVHTIKLHRFVGGRNFWNCCANQIHLHDLEIGSIFPRVLYERFFAWTP